MVFGIILLAIGLFASFYEVTHRVGLPPAAVVSQIVAPYQGEGIVLLAAGIILIASGFFYSPRKRLPPPTSNPP
jgi:hypothetical protein